MNFDLFDYIALSSALPLCKSSQVNHCVSIYCMYTVIFVVRCSEFILTSTIEQNDLTNIIIES